jgi:hypothetical protein
MGASSILKEFPRLRQNRDVPQADRTHSIF